MVSNCSRRALLSSLGTVAVAGCLTPGSPSEATDTPDGEVTPTDGTDPGATPTDDADVESTPTASPASIGTAAGDLPDECPKAPDVEGLPDRPEDPDADAMTEFVAAYERRLAVARNPDYADLNTMEHVSTRRVDGGYRVHFFVEPLAATPQETPVDGGTTPTPTPETVGTYNVGYFVGDRRIVREKQPSAVTYKFSPDDSFDPREGGELIAC